MKLKDDENFWDFYRFTGDFFATDMKDDALEKYGEYLEGEIFAILSKSEDKKFKHGWLIRKEDGHPYMVAFYEEADYMLIITAKVELLK